MQRLQSQGIAVLEQVPVNGTKQWVLIRSEDVRNPVLLFVQVPEVNVPVYFCLGRYDYEVPSVLSARYFESLLAPSKQLVWFESSAHVPNTEEKDRFNEFMIKTVRAALTE